MTQENLDTSVNNENDAVVAQINSEETKQKKKRRQRSAPLYASFFVYILDRLGDAVYDALINGLFGWIFTSHKSLEKRFSSGTYGYALFGNHGVRRILKKIKSRLAYGLESSFFVSRARRVIHYFCMSPLSFYGSFFLFFGIYTVSIYLLKLFFPILGQAYFSAAVAGIACILGALLMIFSKEPLIKAVKGSIIGNMIFQGAFGFSDEAFADKEANIKSRGGIMLFLGLVCGVMTFFISPLVILAAILISVVVVLIAVAPEIGVLLSIICLPFFNFFKYQTAILSLLIFVTLIFYVIKVIRGKRVFKLELVDAFVFLFGLVVIFSSIFGADTVSSLEASVIMCTLMLGYFLLVNLIRTEKWGKRCIIAFVSASSITAFIGIIEYIFGETNQNWLDLSLFSDIRLRVVALFENPNMLSVFLVMSFPFVLALWMTSSNFNEKLLAFFVSLSVIACTVFTWTRGAWLAIILGTVIFFAMYTRKTFRLLGVLLFAIPLAPILLPQTVLNRLLSIANLADSSISYRIYTWRGSLRAIGDTFLSGIGFGDGSFHAVYPHFSYEGIETAVHSHSLFLQILLCGGVIAIVVFAIVFFLYMQKTFEYIKHPQNNSSRIYVIAAAASLVSAMIMGVFDYVWYSYRIFYMFWIVMAIGMAFIRVGRSEINRKAIIEDGEYNICGGQK